MRKFLLLFRILFKQQFSPFARTSEIGKNGKRKNRWWVYLVLFLGFAPLMALVVAASYFCGSIVNVDNRMYVITMAIISIQIVGLVLSVPQTVNLLYDGKDGEKLLPLPVSTRTVLVAKLAVLYVSEAVFVTLLSLLAFIPFGIGARLGASYFASILPVVILVPVLETFVSAFIAMPVALLSKKLGKNGVGATIVKTALYAVIIVAYVLFVVYYSSSTGEITNFSELEQFANFINSQADKIGPTLVFVHPDYALANVFTATNFIYGLLWFLVSFAEHVGVLVVLIVMTMPFYRKMMQKGVEGVGRKDKKKKADTVGKRRGVVFQLVVSDFKRVIRDSQQGFTALYSVVMMPLIAVLIGFLMRHALNDPSTTAEGSQVMRALIPAVMFVYMSFIGAVANSIGIFPISREGKSAYLLKVLPVPFEKILFAKVVFATVVLAVSDAFTIIAFSFMDAFDIFYVPFVAVCLIASGFGNMCVTTTTDLRRPNLDWINFNQYSKSFKSNSLWGLLVGAVWSAVSLAIVVPGMIVYFWLGRVWVVFVVWATLTLVSLIYAFVGYKIMAGKARKYFERIEF